MVSIINGYGLEQDNRQRDEVFTNHLAKVFWQNERQIQNKTLNVKAREEEEYINLVTPKETDTLTRLEDKLINFSNNKDDQLQLKQPNYARKSTSRTKRFNQCRRTLVNLCANKIKKHCECSLVRQKK